MFGLSDLLQILRKQAALIFVCGLLHHCVKELERVMQVKREISMIKTLINHKLMTLKSCFMASWIHGYFDNVITKFVFTVEVF